MVTEYVDKVLKKEEEARVAEKSALKKAELLKKDASSNAAAIIENMEIQVKVEVNDIKTAASKRAEEIIEKYRADGVERADKLNQLSKERRERAVNEVIGFLLRDK